MIRGDYFDVFVLGLLVGLGIGIVFAWLVLR